MSTVETMDRNEATLQLARAIAADTKLGALPWDDLVLVARFGEGVSNVNGFAYQAGGASRPAAPRGAAVLDAFIDLRAATAVDDQADWIACKLHVRRAGGKLSLDFEYERPDRWKISPANVRQMSEALRPTD